MTTILIAVIVGVLCFVAGVQAERRRKPPGNLYRYDMAKHLYGHLAIRHLHECDNAHLPGDCPLCGAS